MPIDPVCKNHVEIGQAAASFDYHSERVYFCSFDCEKRFERDPDSYMYELGEEDPTAGLIASFHKIAAPPSRNLKALRLRK
jgi:YHS domain-containing protein